MRNKKKKTFLLIGQNQKRISIPFSCSFTTKKIHRSLKSLHQSRFTTSLVCWIRGLHFLIVHLQATETHVFRQSCNTVQMSFHTCQNKANNLTRLAVAHLEQKKWVWIHLHFPLTAIRTLSAEFSYQHGFSPGT